MIFFRKLLSDNARDFKKLFQNGCPTATYQKSHAPILVDERSSSGLCIHQRNHSRGGKLSNKGFVIQIIVTICFVHNSEAYLNFKYLGLCMVLGQQIKTRFQNFFRSKKYLSMSQKSETRIILKIDDAENRYRKLG